MLIQVFFRALPNTKGVLFIVNVRPTELSAALSFTTAVGQKNLESPVWRRATVVIKSL